MKSLQREPSDQGVRKPTYGRDVMTTSRSVAKSSSMFSLPRRPSLGASSPAASPVSPSPSPMTATSSGPVTPGSSSVTASPLCDEDEAIMRRKSNNDKIQRLGSTSSLNGSGALPPQPQSQRKLMRSPTSDNLHHQQQQQRQKSRDFALTVSPTSPIPHENCSSLRDQFLKIKERFSAPSPVGGAGSPTSAAASTSTSPHAIRAASPTSASPSTSASTGDSKSTAPTDATSDRRSSSSSLAAVSVPTERLLVELNERSKRGYPGDLLWPNHAHVERWYVEDNYFKGSMTCWSMEKGAEVIARIARVISSRTTPSSPASSSPAPTSPSSLSSSANSSRYNPDVSLQWIGRQLWAVTVSLPLTRSGELTHEHASIAQAIDDAIAEEVKKAPQQCGPRTTPSLLEATAAPPSPSPSAASGVRLNPLLDRLEEEHTGEDASEHAATLPLDFTSATTTENTQTRGEVGQVQASFDEEATSATRGEQGAQGDESPQYQESLTPEADRRAVASDSSVSTVLAEEEQHQDDDRGSSQTNTTQEDGDTLSALPLSLSMLSFSSLQSVSGGGDQLGLSGFSGSGGDHLQLHNGCAKDDDPLHRVPPDKTGWLKKKNGLNSWQPRYFELKGNRLFYFASESEGIPRGAIILDHAHVLRGKGDQSMTFTICASSGSQNLQLIKFSNRMTSQVHPRKSCVLRVVQDSEDAIGAWITAINRASFYCHLSTNSSASGSSNSVTQSSSSTTSSSSPTRKKKSPFYRLRSPSSSASSADDDTRNSTGSASPATIDSASYHHYGSVKYLQDTDPLLWEIHPHDQQKIRKKTSIARTRSDYLSILSKYSSTFRQIFLPRPRPITIEQTLRDILPELFLINNVLYGGGDGNNGLENIFEVLDGFIKKFASAQEERVRAVSALLQACARTISGGDSYFVVHSMLGNPSMIIRPAEARGHPIEIEVSATNPSQFCITVFSAFSFHHIQDVENYGDHSDGNSMPEPLLRVHTYHVQEFDFANGKSTRWLRIRTDGMKDDHDLPGASGGRLGSTTSGGSSGGGWMSKRSASDTGFGALLDALS